MASFGKQTASVLSTELGPSGFRVDRSVYAESFVVAARAETPDVALFLQVRDGTRGCDGFRADLWCAPIEPPDDRLDALGIGYRVNIHHTWDDPLTQFLGITTRRVRLLATSSGALVQAVQAALKAPPYRTPRLRIWRQEVRLFSVASNHPSLRDAFRVLMQAAHASQFARGSKKAVVASAKALLARASDVPELRVAVAALPMPEIALASLAGHASIHALLEHPGA